MASTRLGRKAPADGDLGKVDPPKGDDDKGAGGDDDDDGPELTRGELQDMIDAAVAAKLAAGDEDKGTPPKGDDDKGGRRTLRDTEDEMRRRVEAEVQDVAWREEIVGRVGKIEEAAKPVETPPVRRGWRDKFWS